MDFVDLFRVSDGKVVSASQSGDGVPQNEKALEGARLLAVKEGILAGISSGAAIHTAIEISKDANNKGKMIVESKESGKGSVFSLILPLKTSGS